MFTELYPYLKLVHVVSALLFFGLGGAYNLHKAAVDKSHDFDTLRRTLTRFQTLLKSYRAVGLILFLSGLVLVFTAWGWHIAWVNLALALFLSNLVIGSLVDEPWGKAVKKLAAQGQGELSPEAKAVVADPRMNFSHTLKTGVDFALIFLMTVKPGLWLAVGGAALIIPTYTALVMRRHGLGKPSVAPRLAEEV
ncbi:MAG: DUF2269 family protein [Deinococcota bacterium]